MRVLRGEGLLGEGFGGDKGDGRGEGVVGKEVVWEVRYRGVYVGEEGEN